MNVFLDIDGICCDFSHIIAEATGTDKPMESYAFDDFTPEQAAAAKAALPRAYTEGRPYEGMAELSHKLAEHNEVRYLTARPEWARDKTCEWLRKHGFYMGTVIFNRDKALILSCYPDAVIVEDYGKNIEEILDGSDATVIALMMPKQRYTFNWCATVGEEKYEALQDRLHHRRYFVAAPRTLETCLRCAGVKFEDKKEERNMKLEVGKRYVTRGGKVTSKMEPLYDCYPFMAWVDGYGGISWTNDGHYLSDKKEHELDIVAEYEDKKEEKSMIPEEGKRYTLRNGKVTHGLKMSGNPDFPFMGYVQDSGLMYWTASGRFLMVPEETEFDLVEEYIAPAKTEATIDYKAQLASKFKSLPIRLLETDEGFAKAAEDLAQKLSHAFLVNPFAQLKRRKGQSPVLWEATCLLIERAGVVVEFCDECVNLEFFMPDPVAPEGSKFQVGDSAKIH